MSKILESRFDFRDLATLRDTLLPELLTGEVHTSLS
jgi:hypothetical protein